MSFDWSDYLTLAQELAAQSATAPIREAMLRSAMSRAYYAAFHKAQEHLIIPAAKPGNLHIYVMNKFETSNDLTRKKIGSILHHLRSTRNIADYENSFWGNIEGRTKGVLAEAEEVIRLLSTL